ncbi:MAG: hypothetical protein KIS76_00860 [Pyrinomonadaceae bacterium]|nr:hypothetical protein [Pyrinomonadaceae bacterium]
MGKLLTFIIGALAGILVGGALVFFYFGGVPRAAELPGHPVQPPDQSGSPGGTAAVVLDQKFFDAVLQTIFSQMNAPSFPLNAANSNPKVGRFTAEKIAFQQPNSCDGKITLLPEGSGVRTSVKLENGEIKAPLAFKGSYAVFGQCLQFAGWTQTSLELRYDDSTKDVFGQIRVETVNLDGVSPLASGFVTPIVQTTLNNRVNPITILKGQQIALNLPISATDSTLSAVVSDVRAEIKENELRLFVSYDFAGSKQ